MDSAQGSGRSNHKTGSRLKRLAVGLLALIGACTVIVFSVYALLEVPRLFMEPQRADYVNAFPSPTGDYKALLFTYAGGGGLSPYCNDIVAVVPSSVSDEVAERNKRYEVYSSMCDTFADHSLSPKIEWVSRASLRITFSIGRSGDVFSRKVELKKTDASRKIAVQFIAHE